jgi:hypothetical protein
MNCIRCLANIEGCLKCCTRINAENGRDFDKGTVFNSRNRYREWKEAAKKSQRREVEHRYGLSPHLTNQVFNIEKGKWEGRQYEENPFFRLFDLYSFDIYQQSAIDLFHIILKVVFPTHIDLLHKQLKAKKNSSTETGTRKTEVQT